MRINLRMGYAKNGCWKNVGCSIMLAVEKTDPLNEHSLLSNSFFFTAKFTDNPQAIGQKL